MDETTSDHQMQQQPSSIPLHHTSHSISKLKPKIRVVHLIAPEIIQTDVTNFRGLVQKLTGKPTTNKKRSKISAISNPNVAKVLREVSNDEEKEENFVKWEDPWMNMEGSSSGGYLSYLEEEEGEVEGLFQPSFIGDLSALFHVSS